MSVLRPQDERQQQQQMHTVSTTTIPDPSPRQPRKLYFAYGSNLSSTQMAQRCPASKAVGLAHLPGWDWIINQRRYANIVQCHPCRDGNNTSSSGGHHDLSTPPRRAATEAEDGARNGDPSDYTYDRQPDDGPGVYGVLYELPPADEKTLDRCEGVPWAYEKVMLDVTVFWSASSEEGEDDDKNTKANNDEEKKEEEEQGEDDNENEDKDNSSEVTTATALVYVDFNNVQPDRPWPEYVDRMSRGVREARERWGFPAWFAAKVMREQVPGLVWE